MNILELAKNLLEYFSHGVRPIESLFLETSVLNCNRFSNDAILDNSSSFDGFASKIINLTLYNIP